MTLQDAADAYRASCIAERSANAKLTACQTALREAEASQAEAEASMRMVMEALLEATGGSYFDSDKKTIIYPTVATDKELGISIRFIKQFDILKTS